MLSRVADSLYWMSRYFERADLVREGSYRFHGVTDTTMNHGEGWHFIQLGKYIERACILSILLDAYFFIDKHADELDWVGLLNNCAAFEAYRKACTAELKPERIADFILLQPEFPYSVRYWTEMHQALTSISNSLSRRTRKIERLIGRLRSIVAYVQIGEVIRRDLHKYLEGIIEHNAAICMRQFTKSTSNYPIEVVFET